MTSSIRDAELRADGPQPSVITGPVPADASTGELLTRLSSQLTALAKSELELARAEMTAKGKRVGVGAGLAGTGGVVALFGMGAVVAAAIAAVALVAPVWPSAVIVAVVLFVVAGVLALVGRNSLRKAVPPVPETARETLQQDVATFREAVRR